MRNIILGVLLTVALIGCSQTSSLLKRGSVQCPMGLQVLGCVFSNVEFLNNNVYSVDCVEPFLGRVYVPSTSCVVIEEAAVKLPEETPALPDLNKEN